MDDQPLAIGAGADRQWLHAATTVRRAIARRIVEVHAPQTPGAVVAMAGPRSVERELGATVMALEIGGRRVTLAPTGWAEIISGHGMQIPGANKGSTHRRSGCRGQPFRLRVGADRLSRKSPGRTPACLPETALGTRWLYQTGVGSIIIRPGITVQAGLASRGGRSEMIAPRHLGRAPKPGFAIGPRCG